MTAIERVVLDANVLVSAVIAQGPSYRIVARWLEQGSIEVVVCPTLLAEVDDVLGRTRIRSRISPVVAERFLATLRRVAVVVDDPDSGVVRTRDPNDDYLVALASEHSVDFIVTGDKDLLEWPDQRPPVITPSAFDSLMGE